jgi:small-conductance mechanosensitive channel
VTTLTDIVTRTVEEFVNGIVGALPSLVSGLLFLALAYLFIRLVRSALCRTLGRVYPADQQLIVDFALVVVTVVLWFGAGLVFLKVLGMGDIAASLGTATGFIALGVSYALSDTLADTVAGIYLLKDPISTPGTASSPRARPAPSAPSGSGRAASRGRRYRRRRQPRG